MADAEQPKNPRQISVYLKHAGDAGRWSTVESITKILSAVAIPVVLAVVGFVVQDRLQQQTVQRDYVTLAVSILQESDSKKAPPELKEWAANLLNANAPIKLPSKLLDALRTGQTLLPAASGVSGSIAATPDVIEPGQSAELNWNSFNATLVEITPGVGLVPSAGKVSVSPRQTTTYTISISNSTSATSGTATVHVLASSH